MEAYEVMLVLVSGLLNRLNNHSILIFFYPLSDRCISYILAGYHRLKITLYSFSIGILRLFPYESNSILLRVNNSSVVLCFNRLFMMVWIF